MEFDAWDKKSIPGSDPNEGFRKRFPIFNISE
jgi:hypothetical protein